MAEGARKRGGVLSFWERCQWWFMANAFDFGFRVAVVVCGVVAVLARDPAVIWIGCGITLALAFLSSWLGYLWLLRCYAAKSSEVVWLEPDFRSSLPERYAAQLDELERLGYRLLGAVRRADGHGASFLVYAHSSLPTYVFVGTSDGDGRSVFRFESFFADHGRLTTVSSPQADFYVPCSRVSSPRLTQRRPWGTPTALDGQHTGTLKAWMAGGRRALPASRELLLPYLEEELTLLRAVAAHREVSFGEYLRFWMYPSRRELRF